MEQVIRKAFENIGARVRIDRPPRMRGPLTDAQPVRLNILEDAQGSYFQVDRLWNVELSVPDAVASDRHLLLLAQRDGSDIPIRRFLCGFDERNWFVAAIPEASLARSVRDAKNALKPQEVWDEIAECGLGEDQWDSRWTIAFVRQGEWFFLPRPWMEVDHAYVFRNEPISRGNGKPHWCQYLVRQGGVRVHVRWDHPNGLSDEEFQALDDEDRRSHQWDVRTRDAEVYVRGLISHPDHATIDLPYWHKVVQNTETKAKAMEDVAFLD